MEADFLFSRPFFWAGRERLMSEKYITNMSGIYDGIKYHHTTFTEYIDMPDVTASYETLFAFKKEAGHGPHTIKDNRQNSRINKNIK